MVKRSRGFFSKGTKSTRMEKKLTVNEFVKQFNKGEKVVITIKQHFRGVPHPRYNGKVGEVTGKQGGSYVVKIMDGRKAKQLIVNPVHITKAATKKNAA